MRGASTGRSISSSAGLACPLRKQLELADVIRPYDGEVSVVEGRHGLDPQPLGGGDDGRVDRSEPQVAISRDECGDALPIGRVNRLGDESAGGEIAAESHLGADPEARRHEVRHLGDHELGNEERSGVREEQLEARVMIQVVFVDRGVERAGIYEDRDRPSSFVRISSIRLATSCRPLRPALAESKVRRPRPPTCASIASRVRSEIVSLEC